MLYFYSALNCRNHSWRKKCYLSPSLKHFAITVYCKQIKHLSLKCIPHKKRLGRALTFAHITIISSVCNASGVRTRMRLQCYNIQLPHIKLTALSLVFTNKKYQHFYHLLIFLGIFMVISVENTLKWVKKKFVQSSSKNFTKIAFKPSSFWNYESLK